MVALFVLIKKRLSGWVIPFCSIGIVLSLLPFASAHAVEDSVIAIRGGTVLTMAGETIREGTVLIRNSKIAAVGKNIRIPDGCTPRSIPTGPTVSRSWNALARIMQERYWAI